MSPWRRYRIFILAFLLVLLSLVLLTLSAGRERDLSSPEKIALDILAPVQKAIMSVVDGVAWVGRRYFFLVETAEENETLRREVSRLRRDMVEMRESHLANTRLRRLLEFKEATDTPMLAAEVVGLDPTAWFRTVILDKGTGDGVARGMAVVHNDGVVGRIVEVSRRHAKVLLIIDRNSSVDAVVQRSRTRGIFAGTPDGTCLLKFVVHNADVAEGDMILTSGLTGTFPKGLILGRVRRIDKRDDQTIFKQVTVSPAVDFDRLEEVLIVLEPGDLLNELTHGRNH